MKAQSKLSRLDRRIAEYNANLKDFLKYGDMQPPPQKERHGIVRGFIAFAIAFFLALFVAYYMSL